MKKIIIFLLTIIAAMPAVYAAEEKKTEPAAKSPFGGSAQGGMTYSPTQGWIKTGDQQMKSGTDYLVYQNKKAAEEEARRKMKEDFEKMRELKAAKEKAWEDLQKTEAAKKAQVDLPLPDETEAEAEEVKPKKKKKSAKGRVLVG